MEIRYFLWPSMFLLALLFVNTPETAKEERVSVQFHKEEPDRVSETTLTSIAPKPVHADSGKGMLRQRAEQNADGI